MCTENIDLLKFILLFNLVDFIVNIFHIYWYLFEVDNYFMSNQFYMEVRSKLIPSKVLLNLKSLLMITFFGGGYWIYIPPTDKKMSLLGTKQFSIPVICIFLSMYILSMYISNSLFDINSTKNHLNNINVNSGSMRQGDHFS